MKHVRVAGALFAAALSVGLGAAQAAPIAAPGFFDRASDTTIDFESFPHASLPSEPVVDGNDALSRAIPLTDQLLEAGVRFSAEADMHAAQSTDADDAAERFSAPAYAYRSFTAGGSATSGVGYLGADISGPDVIMPDLRVDFVSSVSAFGLYLIDNDFLTARIQAFDVAGNLLETLLIPKVSNGVSTYAGIDVLDTHATISYFILDGADGEAIDNSFLDDLSFRAVEAQPAPVPLPASLPLLMAGAAGLGFIKRWRRA